MSEKEFKEKILPLSRNLYSISYRLLRTKEDSEDAVQETMLKLWKMRLRLAEYNSTEALAATMLRNHCLDQIRKKKTDSLDSPGMKLEEQTVENSPHEIMMAKETSVILQKILDNMPDGYASLIRQRDIEGMEYGEIALLLNQNVNTLRVSVSRARKMLKDKFNNVTNGEGKDN